MLTTLKHGSINKGETKVQSFYYFSYLNHAFDLLRVLTTTYRVMHSKFIGDVSVCMSADHGQVFLK